MSGKKCQRWDAQSHHGHEFDELFAAENYCRNPDSSDGPWCYTTDINTRWEYCDIPYCGRGR